MQEEHAIMKKSRGRELKERCNTQEEVMDQEAWRKHPGSEVMNRTHGKEKMQRIPDERHERNSWQSKHASMNKMQ